MAEVVTPDAAQTRLLGQVVEQFGDVSRRDGLPVLASEHKPMVDKAVAPLRPLGLLLEPLSHEDAEGAPVQVDDARLA